MSGFFRGLLEPKPPPIPNPEGYAREVISWFGFAYQNVVQGAVASKEFNRHYAQNIRLYCEILTALRAGNAPEKTQVAMNYLSKRRCLTKIDTEEEWIINRIQEAGCCLVSASREIAFSPFLKKYASLWERCIERQSKLASDLYEYLKPSFHSAINVLDSGDAREHFREEVTPCLFRTVALGSPRAWDCSWGSLILEWGRSVPQAALLVQKVIALHPFGSIQEKSDAFYPNQQTLPPTRFTFPDSNEEPCSFHDYVVIRSVEVIEMTIGYPFPQEVTDQLRDVFFKSEDVRMDVLFGLFYRTQFLTCPSFQGDTESKTALLILRALKNLFLGHINAKAPLEAVQTLMVWAFKGNPFNYRVLSGPNHVYAQQEVKRLTKGEEFQVPEKRWEANELVATALSFEPLYSDPLKGNQETFETNVFSVLDAYLNAEDPEKARLALLACFHRYPARISTMQITRLLLHSKDFPDLSALPENLSGPSFYLFDLLVVPSLDGLETFVQYVSNGGALPIDSDAYLQALVKFLQGNFTCEVCRLYEKTYHVTLSLEEKLNFMNQDLPSILPEVNLSKICEDALIQPFVQSTASSIDSLSHSYQLSHQEKLYVFYSALLFRSQPDILTRLLQVIKRVETYTSLLLPKRMIFQLFTLKVSPDVESFFQKLEAAFSSLEKHRTHLILGEMHQFYIGPDVRACDQSLDALLRACQEYKHLSRGLVACFESIVFHLRLATVVTTVRPYVCCFPHLVGKQGELEFAVDAPLHAFVPFGEEIGLLGRSAWRWRGNGYLYQFSVVNHEKVTFSGEAFLALPTQVLQGEPKAFPTLRKLCEVVCLDAKEGKETVGQEIHDFEALIQLDPKAVAIWDSFKPKARAKEVFAQPFFDFALHFKTQLRQALLHLATNRHFFSSNSLKDKGLQEAAAQLNLSFVQVREDFVTYSTLCPTQFQPSNPVFSFYAAMENLACLEGEVTRALQGEDFYSSFHLEAAKSEIVRVETDDDPVFCCFPPEKVSFEEDHFAFYAVTEDLGPLLTAVTTFAKGEALVFNKSFPGSQDLYLSLDHETLLDPYLSLELKCSRSQQKGAVTVSIQTEWFHHRLHVEGTFKGEQLHSFEAATPLIAQLIAQLKRAFYQTLTQHKPLPEQPLEVTFNNQHALFPKPDLYVHCASTSADHLDVTLEVYYLGKKSEATLTIPQACLKRPSGLTSELRYLMACLKSAFYKTHFKEEDG